MRQAWFNVSLVKWEEDVGIKKRLLLIQFSQQYPRDWLHGKNVYKLTSMGTVNFESVNE